MHDTADRFLAYYGSELLARVFLIEPSQAEFRSRTKGTSKRRPNLTYDELAQLAADAGVDELYSYALAAFERTLQKYTTRSSIGFAGLFDGSRKNVISLLPGESNSTDGLRYQLYKNRFGTLAGLAMDAVETLVPSSHDYWIYHASAGPDFEGFQGFITNRAEIDRLAKALSA